MSSHKPSSEASGSTPHETTNRNSEQLERIARLVATGELRFPADLPADQIDQFVAMVREDRRRKLVQFLASRIANSLTQVSE